MTTTGGQASTVESASPTDFATPVPPPFRWQAELYDRWHANGERGVVQAVPGAGKTRAGAILLSRLREKEPDCPVLVVAPTRQIIRQWKEELASVKNVDVVTYFGAVKLAGDPTTVPYRLVIFDECHSLCSTVRGRAIGLRKAAVLGLSATPGDSIDLLGGIITDVGWDEARVSPFDIQYIKFDMTHGETQVYQRLSTEVRGMMQKLEARPGSVPQDLLMATIMKRRSFVYNLPARVAWCRNLVRMNPRDRIMIFSERIDQVNSIVAALMAEGVPTAVLTSECDTLDEYLSHGARVLVSSKMVKEGFNDPSTTMGVLASAPLTQRNLIQTVGRIIRCFPDKTARIYLLLAKNTTDMKLLSVGTSVRGR